MVRHRNNIVIVKLIRPKIVVLPNGRNIYAKYKRASRKALTKTVAIKKHTKKVEKDNVVADLERFHKKISV